MTDLVVHIGLPKAGSTTIQRVTLHDIPGYLGIKQGCKPEKDLGHQLKRMTPAESLSVWKSEVSSWTRRAIDYKNRVCPDAHRLIVSHEGFSRITPSSTFLGRWPIGTIREVPDEGRDLPRRLIAPFLKCLNDEIWHQGNVKALIVLRSQPEWLASLYAQLSDKIKGASQSDFETQLEQLIELGEDYIDWSRWVEALHEALGRENVCALLMEDMNRKAFWEQLGKFMEIDGMDPSHLAQDNAPKENVRRSKDNTWKIRPIRATSLIEKYWSDRRLPHTRCIILGGIRRVSRYVNIDGLTRVILDRNERGVEIEMTPLLRERVQKYCRPFNDRLAEQLGRSDLKELGY